MATCPKCGEPDALVIGNVNFHICLPEWDVWIYAPTVRVHSFVRALSPAQAVAKAADDYDIDGKWADGLVTAVVKMPDGRQLGFEVKTKIVVCHEVEVGCLKTTGGR